jgi:hypothetical protein
LGALAGALLPILQEAERPALGCLTSLGTSIVILTEVSGLGHANVVLLGVEDDQLQLSAQTIQKLQREPSVDPTLHPHVLDRSIDHSGVELEGELRREAAEHVLLVDRVLLRERELVCASPPSAYRA